MKEAAKVIDAVQRTGSYNDKLSILKQYENTPNLKRILRFIYNPYCKTGISAAKAKQLRRTQPLEWSVDDTIKYFSRNNRGTAEDLTVASGYIEYVLANDGPEAASLAVSMITQELKIGITATSLNKVYGEDFIPKTGCMLGTRYEDMLPSRVKWPCIVTEKLDGVRRILVKENGSCRFYSRSGHEDTGLIDIIKEAVHLPDNFVYDGELLAAGTFKDSIAQRQATNSLANVKGVKTGLTFNVFDMVPLNDFYAGHCATSAIDRKTRLAATFNDDSLHHICEKWVQAQCAFGMYHEFKFIKTVPILGLVHNLTEAEPIVEEIWARGGEGIMLNTTLGPYEIKRSKHLLKVKHTEEFVLQIVDLIEGTGKYEDSLGSVIVNYKGSCVGVGSGFTDEQRQTIWNNPGVYIGRSIEVESFGESVNAQGYISLNCPIFKRFVGEE